MRLIGLSLVGLLALSCSGGQTGQPGSTSCTTESQPVRPTQPLEGGVTPRELALAFEGTYTAELAWFEGDAQSDPTLEPVLLDEISIELVYEDGSGRHSCVRPLGVDMAARITTREGHVEERATIVLSGTLESASFTLLGSGVQAMVTLRRTGAGSVEASGSLSNTGGDLPSSDALFPLP